MNAITVSSSTESQLLHLGGPAEVHDAQGNLLGYFTPADQKNTEVYAKAAAHFDATQMRERKASAAEGSTTADVLKRLRSSENA